jgi:hypothetical protein
MRRREFRKEKAGEPDHLEAIAASFRLAGEFFSALGDPKQARRVVDAMSAQDPGEMKKLLEPGPPFPGKCLALCGAVRTIVEGEELREVRLCTLKRGLTLMQRLLAHRIYEKHIGASPRVLVESQPGVDAVLSAEVVDIIWPSPYQDELDANGLVDCWTEKVSVPTWSLGPPSWECTDICV